MKWPSVIIGIGFVIISACMVSLLTRGVSIRPEVMIKPTLFGGYEKVSDAVVTRLFVEFERHPIIVFGVPADDSSILFIEKLKKSYFAITGKKAFITDGSYDLSKCLLSCWVILPEESAHHLKDSQLGDARVLPEDVPHISITLINYDRNETPEVFCNEEKYLDYNCMRSLSISHFYRKFKSKDARYFFLKKYLHRDIFLFIEKSS